MRNSKKKETRESVNISKYREEKGITLIALVITIIVLLILAGISIAMLTGNNGVLTKATEAKDETTQATAEEMVKLAIGSLQTKNLGDRSKITPEAIANQVMEDNDVENVTAEGSEFPTNIVFADNGIKVGVNLDFEIGTIGSYDGIYSESGLEGKIAPEDLFDYEIIDDGALATTGMDSLPEKTARITRIKPQYANGGGYNPDIENTNYGIKYDNDVITKESLLVIPYQVDGKYIPNGIEGELYKVTEVNIFVYGTRSGYNGYQMPRVETIIFPNTIEKMNGYGTGALSGYNNEVLKKVVLSNQLKNIPEGAFCYDTSLENITIPKSVTDIGDYAFENTAWYEKQNDGCIYINNVLYSYKGEMPEGTEINVKEGTTRISAKAFYEKEGLSNIIIPESVTSIGESAFYGTTWYEKQNEGCIYINNILYKYNGWFEEESEVSIRGGTIYINEYAFRERYGLSSLTLPDSVKVIGECAFLYCSSLKTVTYKGTTYTSVSELVETLESNGVTVDETSFSNTGLSD